MRHETNVDSSMIATDSAAILANFGLDRHNTTAATR